MFAATIFVLLPVHGETVAWITGRVDSMPALFYMLAFWAFARWRDTGSRSRGRSALSLALLFVALFTKQTTITLVGDPGGLGPGGPGLADAAVAARPRLPAVRAVDGAYLALRLGLFGQVVRESTLNAEGARYSGCCSSITSPTCSLAGCRRAWRPGRWSSPARRSR